MATLGYRSINGRKSRSSPQQPWSQITQVRSGNSASTSYTPRQDIPRFTERNSGTRRSDIASNRSPIETSLSRNLWEPGKTRMAVTLAFRI